jgi:surface carbohydrate biosynthesis protein
VALKPGVVMLVDDRKRDLPQAALIAFHLERLGVDCHLEPLEAYRAVLGAYRPGMILFNHLNASHLVDYSRRLAKMGVLTAVLPNEGIAYNADQMRYISGQHHRGAHIDWFFCWNQVHRDALRAAGFGERTRIEVVGVPRFDFYFEPWARVFRAQRPRSRPRVLLCTNFQIARFWELPKEKADKFFSAWRQHIPLYRDYWKAVEDSFNGRRRMFDYADALVAADRFEVVLRPHPREEVQPYEEWLARVPAASRRWVRLEPEANITTLLLDSDLEISCETCTTAIETWVVGKPSIELLFFKNPLLYHPEHGAATTPCDSPADLPGLIDRVLREGEAPQVVQARQSYLAKWCDSPRGASSERMARLIAEALGGARAPDWSGLTVADKRRSTKLKLLRNLGLAYHFDPLMPVKMRVNRGRYAIKDFAYRKSIKPRDVAEVRARLVRALGSG